jgi:dTDP-4-dehydrorhamnose 3,5-epimerase
MIEHLSLQGAKLIDIKRLPDNRGWFSETFKETWISDLDIPSNFVFEFWSYNVDRGTLRGLHSQIGDTAPGKLIQVLTGAIQDVIVDARENSPTYGRWLSIELSAKQPRLLYVPRGFYHGYVTLEPETYVGYKVDQYRTPQDECGVSWNDPTLNIQWALDREPIISHRDSTNPLWAAAAKFQL